MAKLEQKRFAAVVRLLQIAYPKDWERHLRDVGVSASAELPPAELDRIMERVYWLVRQTGIKDPAAWIATDMARVEAALASVEPEAPVKVAPDVAVRQNPVELEPVKPGVDLAKTSGASPPTLETATGTNSTTIAELLSRAKLAIEAGEKSLREAADAMAIAQEVYGASQQEIAAAVGKSQAWVSRVLQWRREGFKDDTPFGPASKAARVRAANYQATDKAVAKRAKPEANGVEAEAQVKDALVRAAELSRIACNGAALGTEAEPQEEQLLRPFVGAGPCPSAEESVAARLELIHERSAVPSTVRLPFSTFARARRSRRALSAATSAIRSAARRRRARSRWRWPPSAGKC